MGSEELRQYGIPIASGVGPRVKYTHALVGVQSTQ